MKRVTLQLTQFDFANLKNLILMLEYKNRKCQKKFSGTKLIEYDFILIPMLKDRYLFRYTAEKLIGIPNRFFSMELYQAAALYYFLQDTDDLPKSLIELKADLRYQLSDYLYGEEKSEFQKNYENVLFESGFEHSQLSFLEFKEQQPIEFINLKRAFEDYEKYMASLDD